MVAVMHFSLSAVTYWKDTQLTSTIRMASISFSHLKTTVGY